MKDSNSLAAQLLETSAAAYASAAHALLRELPDLGSGFAHDSAAWKSHIKHRILELATAIRVDRPEMFVRRINWLRRAIKARGGDEQEMRAVLESLRIALDHEFPEQLKSAVEQPIRLALDMLEQDLEPEAGSLDGSTSLGRLGLKYLAACLEARTDKAVALILDALDNGVTPQEAYTEVLLPVQQEAGRLWHRGDVSVAEERLVSETTREVMTLIVNRHATDTDADLPLLAASVAGNAHDIGLRAVADLFKLAGWRTVFLGADMPTREIVLAI
jgi:methanogenic corrinoid protein MtbC1